MNAQKLGRKARLIVVTAMLLLAVILSACDAVAATPAPTAAPEAPADQGAPASIIETMDAEMEFQPVGSLKPGETCATDTHEVSHQGDFQQTGEIDLLLSPEGELYTLKVGQQVEVDGLYFFRTVSGIEIFSRGGEKKCR